MPVGKPITPADEKASEEDARSFGRRKEPPVEFFPEEPRWSFDDIILPQSVKDKILDVATYAENSKKVFEVWGLQKVYKQAKRIGINFYGAPGTGKTMAAHAVAKYLGRKILIVNYADIESKYVGETPKNIRKAFEAAKASDSILFFDEADAILSKRVTAMTSATDVSVNQTRSVMLMLMNDYQDFVIFATNFIENFDPAFMRRISTHIEFKLPDLDCRKKLWRHYIVPTMPNNINIDELDVIAVVKEGGKGSATVLRFADSVGGQFERKGEFVITESGVGGGLIRDVLASRVPEVFQKHVYALASILGAVVAGLLARWGVDDQFSVISGFLAIVLLRVLAARFRWNLPRVGRVTAPPRSAEQTLDDSERPDHDGETK